MFERIHKLGQKISGVAHKGMALGEKVAGHVSSIAKKVIGVSKVVRPFLPDSMKDKFDAVVGGAQTAANISAKVQGGIATAKSLEAKAKTVKSLSGGVAVASEAFFAGKNAVNSTRAMLERPAKKDATAKQAVITATPKPTDRAALRSMANKGLKDIGTGLLRHGGDGDVAKAVAAAKMAQTMLNQRPSRRGGFVGKK